jgi:hypothetical protein
MLVVKFNNGVGMGFSSCVSNEPHPPPNPPLEGGGMESDL